MKLSTVEHMSGTRSDGVQAQGYLVKRGHRIKNWKRRYFELHAGDGADPEDSPPTLTYAASSGGKTLGVVKLIDVEVVSSDRDVHRMHSFTIRCKSNKAGGSNAYALVLTSHSPDDKARWMRAIRQVALPDHGAQLLGTGANAAQHV